MYTAPLKLVSYFDREPVVLAYHNNKFIIGRGAQLCVGDLMIQIGRIDMVLEDVESR